MLVTHLSDGLSKRLTNELCLALDATETTVERLETSLGGVLLVMATGGQCKHRQNTENGV